MALILIAENSASERKRLRQIVEAQDHVVVEADNGAYCLELIEVHRIDGALFNLFLSGVEVPELLQALQKHEIPAIAIAEELPEHQRQQFIDQGAFAVLNQSSSAGELSQNLAAALGLEPLPQTLADRQTVANSPPENSEESLLSFSVKTLSNLMSIGIEQAGETLNELTDCPIEFQIPVVETLTFESLQQRLQEHFGVEPICAAQLPFSGEFSGTARLLFPTDSAQVLTQALTGEQPESPDFEQAKEEMLTEVGNIVLNSVIGAIGNAVTQELRFSVPTYVEDSIDNLLHSSSVTSQAKILLAQARFNIEELQIAGDIILFFQVE